MSRPSRGIRVSPSGPAPREWGYTAVVGSFKVRAVGIAMIAALAGTPAAAAACAALCLPAIHGSSMAMENEADPHAAHRSMLADGPHMGDERSAEAPLHHSSLANEHETSRSVSGGAVEVAAVSDPHCCTSDDTVLTASVAAVRADAAALLATVAVFATPFHLLVPRRSEPRYSPPIAPPSSTRVPLVLRV